MECPDRGSRFPIKLLGRSGAQLGKRDRDGDSDRAQGRYGRSEGTGTDDSRSPDETGECSESVGLLPECSDKEDELYPADPSDRQAGCLAQQKDHGSIPAGDAQVLLRSFTIQDLPRTARDSLPNPSRRKTVTGYHFPNFGKQSA